MTATHNTNGTVSAAPVLYLALDLGAGTWKLAFSVGLPCGGEIDVWVSEPDTELLDSLAVRYRRFLKEYPGLADRLPVHHLARAVLAHAPDAAPGVHEERLVARGMTRSPEEERPVTEAEIAVREHHAAVGHALLAVHDEPRALHHRPAAAGRGRGLSPRGPAFPRLPASRRRFGRLGLEARSPVSSHCFG